MLAGVGTAPVLCSRFCGAGGRVAVLLHTVCGLLLHLVSLGILVSVSADVRRLLFCSFVCPALLLACLLASCLGPVAFVAFFGILVAMAVEVRVPSSRTPSSTHS